MKRQDSNEDLEEVREQKRGRIALHGEGPDGVRTPGQGLACCV